MKRILLLGIAFYFATSSFAQFDLRQATPYSYFMEDVFYADSNTSLITGSNYYATSLDHGKNWHGLGSSGMFVKAAYYPNNRFGIAVGNDGKYRTNTQCAYFWGWSNIKSLGVYKDLKDAFFMDENVGLVCGDEGSLISTKNGTLTWDILESNTLNNLNGLHMLTDSLAFVCGSGGEIIQLRSDTVYSSQIIDAATNFSKIYFTNEMNGFIVGSGGTIYKTEDQGETWSQIDLGISDDLFNIDFMDANHGSICGDNGLIFTTFDAGDSWSEGAVVPDEEIRAIAFRDHNYALALGSNFVLSTDDGGLTWVRITGDLRSIDFPTEENGYAVGFWGTAFRTKDGGNNWEAMDLNTTQYLNDVYFLNADTGFVVGGHEMYRTEDGGDSWTSLPIDVEGSLYGVHFSDYNHGVAVGYRRGILHTDDAGETWDYQYSWGSEVWYHGVQFTSQDTGYFCSSSGVIYKSVDGGEDWEVQSTGNNISLANTHFINSDVGWAVGSQGKIVKTTNGGEDWISQDSGVDTYLGGIDFFNADTGIVTGSDGTYIVTYNGGDTWIDYSNGYADWSDFTLSPNGIAFAVAGTRISAIAPFTTVSMTYARCGGDRIYYNTFTPFFNNDETHSVVVELTSAEDDYTNAIPLLYLEVDSVALVDAYLPEEVEEGVYKYRLRDVNDSSWVSFDRYFKMTTTPQLNLTLVDSILYANTAEDVHVAWYYRESPSHSGYWIGNGDSIQVPGSGEIFVQGNSECCDATIPWTMIGVCDGELILQEQFVIENDYALCNGDSILIEGTYYSEEGVYRDSLINSSGCDSVLVSTVYYVFPDSIPISESICSNETYQVGESIYSESGNYIDTLVNNNGCDSIVYLDLLVFDAYSLSIDTSICTGDSLIVGESIYYESGMYIDSLSTFQGCDSIIHTELTVFFQGDSIQDFAICEGDSIVIGTSVYSNEGNYIDSIYNSIGCLSVYYTYLSVNSNPVVNLGNDTTICTDQSLTLDAGEGYSSYLWNTEEFSQTIIVSDSSLYNVIVEDENGCIGGDSILVLTSPCTSIEELESSYGISVYPNPNSGEFFIESDSEISVLIYNSNGSIVYQNPNLLSTVSLNIDESGLYIIHFIMDNENTIFYTLMVNK